MFKLVLTFLLATSLLIQYNSAQNIICDIKWAGNIGSHQELTCDSVIPKGSTILNKISDVNSDELKFLILDQELYDLYKKDSRISYCINYPSCNSRGDYLYGITIAPSDDRYYFLVYNLNALSSAMHVEVEIVVTTNPTVTVENIGNSFLDLNCLLIIGAAIVFTIIMNIIGIRMYRRYIIRKNQLNDIEMVALAGEDSVENEDSMVDDTYAINNPMNMSGVTIITDTNKTNYVNDLI